MKRRGVWKDLKNERAGSVVLQNFLLKMDGGIILCVITTEYQTIHSIIELKNTLV